MKQKNYISALILSFTFVFLSLPSRAQDDLLSQVDSAATDNKDFVLATFKTTRNINFHTVEVLGKRTLDFRISHRFGEVNTGSYNAWGIDGPANIRLGLEYSYDGRLMAGFGRSSYQKMLDGFLKYRLLRQTENDRMPVSVTLVSSMFYTLMRDPDKATTGVDKYKHATSRMSYVNQVIIGRKITGSLSLQLAPVFVHYNQVDDFTDLNDMFLIAAAGRMKISNRFAVTAEYSFALLDYSKRKDYHNSLGIGFDIETGGHVFQIHMTNSFGIADNQFYPYTSSSWKENGMRIGFNVSRVFTL